jgi:two-component system C4-dicarboxylate transport sensor histidine kinase DctB
MRDPALPPEWLDRANRLATIAWLLSTTIHDANNILMVISGNAEMIEDLAAGNELLVKRGRSIGTNARKASALLSELLEFSRDTVVPPAVIDLRELADRSLALRLYAMKKLRIATAVEGEAGVRVRTHPRDAVQIIVNLLVNAERALADRPDSKVTLTVGGDAAAGTIGIEDNGPGLPDDRRNGDVFGSRAGEKDDRLGIGLSVAHRLAARHGGALTYAPRAGGGCVFTLSLPRG